MDISSISSDNSISQLAVDLGSKTQESQQAPSIAASSETNNSKYKLLDDGYCASEDIALFKEIAADYDITNISNNEAKQMYRELYDNDLISLKDLYVTFDYSKFPEDSALHNNSAGWNASWGNDNKINLLESLKSQYSEANKSDILDKNQVKINLLVAEKIHFLQTSS